MFQEIEDYIIHLKRKIHMHPEVNFDLPKTVAVVERVDAKGGVECACS